MKEKVKRALNDAFGTYWTSHPQVKIDGKEYAKTNKFVGLYFSDNMIDMLQDVIYFGHEKKTITGTIEGYVCGIEQGNSKSKNLSIKILSLDYECCYDENNTPHIQINNVMFQSK